MPPDGRARHIDKKAREQAAAGAASSRSSSAAPGLPDPFSPFRTDGSGGAPERKFARPDGASPAFQGEPKWRRRAEARPDEILDAALAAFTEQGFEATPVDDIARRAGISKAGLYIYFESKEALLRALIEREIAPLARALRELAENGADDPETTLGGIIAAVSHAFRDPRLFAAPRIVFSVAPRFPEIGAYYREHVVDEALAAMRVLIEAGVDRGIFRDIDPDLASRAVMGPLILHAMRTHVLGGPPDDLDPTERAYAQLDLLMRGIAA